MPNQGIDELDTFLDKVIKPRFLTYSCLLLGDEILNSDVKSPNNPDWNHCEHANIFPHGVDLLKAYRVMP